jgi:DNA polymerase III sliding clamp (beta) subunit (PCNA family)
MNNTLENTKVMQAVSVSAPALMELLTGAGLHAHAKADIPALNSIRIKESAGELMAEATDRYRLVRGSIPVFLVENESGTLDKTIISLDDSKRVIALCKSLDKRSAITLTRSGDILSVSSAGSSITINALDVKVPSFDQFLEPVKPVALTGIRFNPKFYGDLAKLCGKNSAKSGVYVSFGVAENKPMNFTIDGESVKWHGAIMPMRKAN